MPYLIDIIGNNTIAKLLTSSFFLIIFSACSVTQQVSDDEVRSKYADISPREGLQSTSERYAEMIAEKYDYYAPRSWQLAAESLEDARKIASENPDSLQILKNTYMAEKHLDSAAYIKSSSMERFEILFQLQRTLNENKAQASYGSQLTNVNNELRKILVNFEDMTLGINSETANKKTIDLKIVEIKNAMEQLNVRVVKFNYLDKGKKDLEQLGKLKADVLSPVTYKEAITALKTASQYIEENVYNKDEIADLAAAFTFAVSHCRHILDAVVSLSKKEAKQLEAVILENEQNLFEIAQALKVEDVRDRSIREQKQVLLEKVAGVYDHHSEKSSMIIDLSEENMRLQAELKSNGKIQDEANEILISQIKELKQELQSLEKEKMQLKKTMSALQQKNIDLAIEIADLTSKLGLEKENIGAVKSGGINKDASLKTGSKTGINHQAPVNSSFHPSNSKIYGQK